LAFYYVIPALKTLSAAHSSNCDCHYKTGPTAKKLHDSSSCFTITQYTKASRVSIMLYNPCKVCLKKVGWMELAIDI
jgi:hypothetical protein